MKRALGNRPLRKARVPAGIEIRTFRPGTADEHDWLRVNAEAFADHPEQGRFTAEDLAARMAEPWFDPEGFFVAYRGEHHGRLPLDQTASVIVSARSTCSA